MYSCSGAVTIQCFNKLMLYSLLTIFFLLTAVTETSVISILKCVKKFKVVFKKHLILRSFKFKMKSNFT